MKHDFKSIPDRSKFGSAKWEGAKNASTEFVPLSVADMEFPTAKPIVNAIKKLADEAILGYTNPTEEYFDALISWQKRRHNFEIEKDWVLQTPGVINALSMLIEATTRPGDGIIIMSPVYYPFDMTVVATSRRIVYCPLINLGDRYEINYAEFRRLASSSKNTALLFSNPHNPIGKVWSREELEKVSDICCENGVFIIDDEIHNDLIMPGYTHTVMATINEKTKNNIAVCTAPSKTFNLAGLQCSNIIIPNEKIRARAKACNWLNMQMHLNIFAYTACTAAYNKCEDWLEELIKVIAENAKCVEDFMAENFPEIKVYPLEGTYLQWLDVRALGLTHVEMRELLEKANIYLDNGEMFGPLGRGFQRINLACAKETIERMLMRFKNAVDEVRAKREAEGSIPMHKTLRKGDVLEGFEYTSLSGETRDLSNFSGKNTLIVFARYYECEITQKLLSLIKTVYPALNAMGCDVKAVIQTDAKKLSLFQDKYPFELISDEAAVLYDRYNVFAADSGVNLISGDKMFETLAGKDITRLLGTGIFEKYITPEKTRRNLQLCAFIAVDKNMKVTYSHYCKTVADFPDIKNLVKSIK
ncbi:MAG: PatB family C-S lyase [Clostridia bacterium]|nr:PatB family C-S lyase [Clostridia bacterium]